MIVMGNKFCNLDHFASQRYFIDWYNFVVPTPFYHLNVAQALLAHPKLPDQIKVDLTQHESAFYLGHIAPDVQVVSQQKRAETHFYTIPIDGSSLHPWDLMIQQHPDLLAAHQGAAHLMFIAGYLCHLQVDWYWTKEIYEPIFGPALSWATRRKRAYLHNVLRSYLDQLALKNLANDLGAALGNAQPCDFLPFVTDRHLIAWQKYLAEQLHPGAIIQTVEVFANRQGISPQKYYDLLGSNIKLEQKIFTRIPRIKLDIFLKKVLNANIVLLQKTFQVKNEMCGVVGGPHENL